MVDNAAIEDPLKNNKIADIAPLNPRDLELQIKEKVSHWRKLAARHRSMHYLLAVLLLICALLAPLTAVTSATTAAGVNHTETGSTPTPSSRSETNITTVEPLTFIGLTPFWTGWISFALTLLAGFLEGLRRIFVFERRWRDFNEAALLSEMLYIKFSAKYPRLGSDEERNFLFEDTVDKWVNIQQQEQKDFFNVAISYAEHVTTRP